MSWSTRVRGRHAVDSRGVRRRMWTRGESLEPAHVALYLRLGYPAAAADVYGTQIPALHERVHRRATDAENLSGLFGREEEPIRGHGVPKRLQITHVDISRISRAFVRDGCWPTMGERPSEHLQYLPAAGIRALTLADWRVERLLPVLQKPWRLS